MKHYAFIFVMLGLIYVLYGCVGKCFVHESDNKPPSINDVQVNPTSLRFIGGQITISAKVIDSSGIAEVWANVEKPDGMKEQVIMSQVDGVYQGTMRVRANTRNDGQVEVYKVWVRAKDLKGNETPEPGEPVGGISFSVSAPEPPPEAPKL